MQDLFLLNFKVLNSNLTLIFSKAKIFMQFTIFHFLRNAKFLQSDIFDKVDLWLAHKKIAQRYQYVAVQVCITVGERNRR